GSDGFPGIDRNAIVLVHETGAVRPQQPAAPGRVAGRIAQGEAWRLSARLQCLAQPEKARQIAGYRGIPGLLYHAFAVHDAVRDHRYGQGDPSLLANAVAPA